MSNLWNLKLILRFWRVILRIFRNLLFNLIKMLMLRCWLWVLSKLLWVLICLKLIMCTLLIQSFIKMMMELKIFISNVLVGFIEKDKIRRLLQNYMWYLIVLSRIWLDNLQLYFESSKWMFVYKNISKKFKILYFDLCL